MSETEQDLQPVEIAQDPAMPSLPNRFRSFLRNEYNVNLGDITAREYDRATIAPHIAQFVLWEVRDDPSSHVSGPRFSQKIHALSVEREIDKPAYKERRARAEENIRRLLRYVPEMQVASDLQESFRDDEVGIVIHDVLIALGSLKHPIASRNAAINTGGEPPTPSKASA